VQVVGSEPLAAVNGELSGNLVDLNRDLTEPLNSADIPAQNSRPQTFKDGDSTRRLASCGAQGI